MAGICRRKLARGTEWAHAWEQGRMGKKENPDPRSPLAGVRFDDNIVRAWGGGNNGNFLAWACGPSFGK